MSATAQALRTAATATRQPANESTLAELLAGPHISKFDPDAWHVMQERDNALIRDEIMHGYASSAFVYSFEIKGSRVNGISVVGARELASQYKGIKARIVATVEKRGALFIFRSFSPLNIETRVLHELEGEEDFYECVMEVSDIKSGNSIEVRKKESKLERKRDGGFFERPHFDVIAEAKAYRNGVLSVLPQSVIRDFQARCLAAGKASGEKTIQQRRADASAYAAKHAIALNRQALNDLSFAELDGLGGAAQTGLDAFKAAAAALGLIAGEAGSAPPPADPPAPPPAPAARGAKGSQAPAPAPPATDTGASATVAPDRSAARLKSFMKVLDAAKEGAECDLMLDEARDELTPEDLKTLNDAFTAKFPAQK